MSISALSNTGLLQYISSSSIAAPVAGFDTKPKVQEPLEDQIAAKASSAQLAEDTYAPSTQNSQRDNSEYSLVDSLAPSAGVSKDTMDAMLDAMSQYEDPLYSSWYRLASDLNTGNLTAAQNDFSVYSQTLTAEQPTLNMSSLTAPSSAFMSDLDALGKALNAGDLAAAQTAFATADNQGDPTADHYGLALGKAENDGGATVQGLQDAVKNNTLFTADFSQLASDVKNLDDLAREGNKNITEYLVSKGFSSSDASAYATAVTGISNGTAAENANVDATRTTQWMNALTNYVKSGITPSWYVEAPTPGDPMFTAIAGIMNESSIAAWNQTHTLVNSTLETNNTGSSTSTT